MDKVIQKQLALLKFAILPGILGSIACFIGPPHSALIKANSQIGVTSSMAPKRVVIHYPVLWILNPDTGRCKRYDLMDYKDQITKKNYRGIAETAHFIVIITDSNYYSFANADGAFIKTTSVSSIKGRVVGVQADGILFLDGNTLILRDQDFNILRSKECQLTGWHILRNSRPIDQKNITCI